MAQSDDPSGEATRSLHAGKKTATTPAYELFVLGELMGGQQYGYNLKEILQRILGPLHRLSWGTLYPLLHRLEQQGLITSCVDERPSDTFPQKRGLPRRQYSLNEAGRARFFVLMLEPGDATLEYPVLFAVQLTKLAYLSPGQQRLIFLHYRAFLQKLHDYYVLAQQRIMTIPGITNDERPYILQLTSYRQHTFAAELSWIDAQLAALSVERQPDSEG